MEILTYQDYTAAADRGRALLEAVEGYRRSAVFRTALEADAYFRGENPAVARKTILRAGKVELRDEQGRRRVRPQARDVVGNRIPGGFLHRFVVQQNQDLLGSGCTLGDPALKARLGPDFDRTLARMGEKALLHGVCWGFWNADRLELIEACRDALSGFFALPDEWTGEPRLGVQFWQAARDRPLCVRLFAEDGVSMLRRDAGGWTALRPPRPYVLRRVSDLTGERLEGENWPALPLIPFWANPEHRSELTPAIRAKIDAYDRSLSDFADNLDRANDVYWVLNNFSGTVDDVADMLEAISRLKAVANFSDGTGASATAEPRTIAVPHAARQAALTLLERALYRDWLALDTNELTGGSLTNVAIRAATAALDQKADRFEWEAFAFVRALLRLLGADTDAIRFTRRAIANESETVADIAVMRPDIDRRTALRLNPYIQPEEVEALAGPEARKLSTHSFTKP